MDDIATIPMGISRKATTELTTHLGKGGSLALHEHRPQLETIYIGLGWDVASSDAAPCDLDASVFLLNNRGAVRNDVDFIFYNNKKSICGSVNHQGDNRKGDAAGDDESIRINLKTVPADIEKIIICVSIHQAKKREQNFTMVNNAFIRIVDVEDSLELTRFNLHLDECNDTAVIFGELHRIPNTKHDWKFWAIGQGDERGLKGLALEYGVNL